MNIITFSYCLEYLMSVNIKKVLQQCEQFEYISSDEKILKYKINLKARIPKSLEDLREAEERLNTGDTQNKRAFSDIMTAANAEISATEDPLFFALEDNLMVFQKATILDPDSTEFEMMLFYLKNHVIELMRRLLAEQFDVNKIRVEIREKSQ